MRKREHANPDAHALARSACAASASAHPRARYATRAYLGEVHPHDVQSCHVSKQEGHPGGRAQRVVRQDVLGGRPAAPGQYEHGVVRKVPHHGSCPESLEAAHGHNGGNWEDERAGGGDVGERRQVGGRGEEERGGVRGGDQRVDQRGALVGREAGEARRSARGGAEAASRGEVQRAAAERPRGAHAEAPQRPQRRCVHRGCGNGNGNGNGNGKRA
jgi:hypothetical protein